MNGNSLQPKDVHKLITDWSSPNDSQRRPAEEAIEQLLIVSHGQIDNFVMLLCQLLAHPQKTSNEVRMRIAILLRKRIVMKLDDESKQPIFCQLQANTRQQTLRVLLKQLGSDPDKDTRNQIADLVTELTTRTLTILSKDYENTRFMKCIFELYNLSDTASNDNSYDDKLNAVNRINALQIFGHICQFCASDAVVQRNQASILQLYKVAFIQDKHRQVNIAALEAIQLTMKPLREPAIFGFIPLMFDVLKLLEHTLNNEGQQANRKRQQDNQYVITEDDYEQTQYILEIIIRIACDQPTLFADHNEGNNAIASPLIPFCTAFTQLAVTSQLPNKVRSLALEFFLSLAENDPSFTRKKTIIAKSVINICVDHFLISQTTHDEWGSLVYGEDEDHNDLSTTGEYALDRLVCVLSADYVLPAIYSKLGMVQDQKQQNEANEKYWNSNNWKHRHCAVTVMTQISDHIHNECNELLLAINKCIQLFSDPNHRIKYAVINAIGQLSNDHYDVIGDKFSDAILKNLLLCLSDSNHIKIQTHACAALISIVPSLTKKHIKGHLDALLNGVMNVLKSSNKSWQNCNAETDNEQKTNYQKAQEQALTAIAALAQTADDLFNEYYDIFAPVLMSIVKSAHSDAMEDIRCNAIECMGCFGEAVGRNKFSVHATELMNGTISFFKNRNVDEIGDDPFIKTNISVWPRVLAALGTEAFYQYLPTICQILVSVASINIISNRNNEVQDVDFSYEEFQAKNVDNETMAIIETAAGFIALDSSKMENKLAALYVMDAMNENYGAKMTPFVPKWFDVVLGCIACKYSSELRSESIKLAPRYVENMILGIKEREQDATPQLLQSMSEKLLTVLMSVLDEGKGKNNDGSSETACIGTAVKTLLEFIQKIDPIDSEEYNQNQSMIRRFVDAQKLEYMIDSLFLCVLRAQNRIELYSNQAQNSNFDQIAKLEFEEEKEFEDELLFNIAMVLAQFIKIYRDDFLSILFNKKENIQKLLNFLNPQNVRNPQFIHKTGIYIICDIYEQCSVAATSKLLSSFIPQIMNIVRNDHDAAVNQAAFYCLGLMVAKCKNAVNIEYIQQILSLCMECITKHSKQYTNASISVVDAETAQFEQDQEDVLHKKRQFLGVIDNAMASICKISKDIDWSGIQDANLNKLRNESLSIWFKHLPVKSDCVEGQICHEYLLQLIHTKNPIIVGNDLSNLPFIFKVFATIRNTKLSSDKLDKVIPEFVSTICQSQPQFASGLSQNEKKSLGLL